MPQFDLTLKIPVGAVRHRAGQAEGARHQDLVQSARAGRHPAGRRRGQPGRLRAGGDQAAARAAVQGRLGGPAALRAGGDQQPGVRPRGAARPAAVPGKGDQLRDRDGRDHRSPRANCCEAKEGIARIPGRPEGRVARARRGRRVAADRARLGAAVPDPARADRRRSRSKAVAGSRAGRPLLPQSRQRLPLRSRPSPA